MMRILYGGAMGIAGGAAAGAFVALLVFIAQWLAAMGTLGVVLGAAGVLFCMGGYAAWFLTPPKRHD